MVNYHIKTAAMLSALAIKVILQYWEEEEWSALTTDEFKRNFAKSEFHLLTDEHSNILCVTRVNFDFKIELNRSVYTISELVGLVSVEKMKGHAKQLLRNVAHNLNSRGIECVGFCEKELRPFYEKCEIPILYGQAKYLKEKQSDEFIDPNPDDDILAITLSKNTRDLLAALSDLNTGYLLFE